MNELYSDHWIISCIEEVTGAEKNSFLLFILEECEISCTRPLAILNQMCLTDSKFEGISSCSHIQLGYLSYKKAEFSWQKFRDDLVIGEHD